MEKAKKRPSPDTIGNQGRPARKSTEIQPVKKDDVGWKPTNKARNVPAATSAIVLPHPMARFRTRSAFRPIKGEWNFPRPCCVAIP